MNIKEYQEQAKWGAPNTELTNENLSYCGLGLSGEAGEITDYLKKIIFHSHNLNKEKLEEELGDLLWYVSYSASVIGSSLEDIAIKNIEKAHRRYPEGWDVQRSINRENNK